MKKRVVIALTGLLTLSLAGIAGFSTSAATNFISQGRVEFNNNTPNNRADDVVFDVDDLKALDVKIAELNNAVTELENSGGNNQDMDQAREEGKQEGIAQTMVGTAIESQVLLGETFTNSKGVGLTGTMPDHGALNWAPSSSTTMTVQPGYYSGGTLDSSAAYSQGYVDGQNNVTENLNIQYTYHVHEGEADKGTGCYTKAVKHKHKASCNGTCPGKIVYVSQNTNSDGNIESRYDCNVCGFEYYLGAPYNDGSKDGDVCIQTTIICNKAGNSIDSYDIGCGKTEKSIESALIVYH